jgi:mannose-6-phosphate isomerase-like protein (cupin superfamily)
MSKSSIVNREDAPVYGLLGDTYRLLALGSATNKTIGVVEAVIQPDNGPPPHVNEREALTWYVQEGELTFLADGEQHLVRTGGCIYMAANMLHTFKNTGKTPARALMISNPGGFEGMFAQAGVKLTEGEAAPAPGPADVARLMETAPSYGLEIRT